MREITDNLIKILEGLYASEKRVGEIVCILQESRITGQGLLNKSINEIEYTIIKYLGGSRKNLYFFRELLEKDPFHNLEQGNITKEEFLKQIKRGIELDLTPEAYLKGYCSAEDIIK
ncbi:hypothetical protein NSA56_02785 [Oceanobacillus caeni]|uniref:hypothetical protein n=1 Tax=Oceanobacillus TaxID=182709 RepID=UPI00062225E4|nr:hypothetical protein [Oceanobacillus caeni]KKE79716.1 hypothetical protein WH51_06460 [Bacilli bacterium VT-13-104]PZD89569.1 hypothetical protein DEJ64_00550 [Bacilli bacterium]MCR1833321.1 hypothetical protein [Oceanobacillus caeni]PZD91091.1 hypothetical protein DEJ60_00550 [Bacilli bacterium]PZD92638.1 hypothetical protein DEJ66_00550 [Bacilli bacterium]